MSIMYKTKIFTEVFDDYGTFKYHYINCGIPQTIGSDDSTSTSSLQTLYYLLYARFGNSPISNMDENQFIYKVFSIIFQYGATWEKKLSVQAELRSLTEEDLLSGAFAIQNHAFNPSTDPATDSEEILEYINEQNTSKVKKPKIEAYLQLYRVLNADMTEEFLRRFNVCFKQFVGPEYVFPYATREDEI